MKHEIDLKNYHIRTDLILDQINNSQLLNKKEFKKGNVVVTSIILKQDVESLQKSKGHYITIGFEDITDKVNYQSVMNTFIQELKKLIKKLELIDKKVLIVGLGNDNSTPDSLGPRVIKNIIVTRHLFEISEINVDSDYSNVSTLTPGVMGNTGIESYELIKGVITSTNPDYIIVIDALASSSINNLNKTIQLTDTGISPGSGIGNVRKEISSTTLGLPVIAIGVPTVVDAVTIVSDTISYLTKKLSYNKNNINNVTNKLKPDILIDYMRDNTMDLSQEEKNKFLGYIGSLSKEEFKQLIYEVLTPIGYNLMVTPKEVDFIIDKMAKLLGEGINKTLHKMKIS